jgi:hypothetical protein
MAKCRHPNTKQVPVGTAVMIVCKSCDVIVAGIRK